ncbi:MAG TPA: hypothetical protein VKR06_20500, partial [Ktedonosporobacter sp.]|nr:hypothetical protein [Ktedonosporobacter sp.]
MNLWTDLDNSEQQQLDTARPGRPQRPRRPTEHAIFSDLRAWLLQDYVSTYCRSLGATRIFRRCYWIDALGLTAKARSTTLPADESRQGEQPEPAPTTPSGKRRKKNGAQSIPPALQPIVNLSQALGQESKPITLHGLLLEGGSSQRHSPRHEAKAAQNGTAKITELSLPKESAILRASWL